MANKKYNIKYFVRVNTRDSIDNGTPVEGGEVFYYYDEETKKVLPSRECAGDIGILPRHLEKVIAHLYSIHPILESTNGRLSENEGGAFAICLQIGLYSYSMRGKIGKRV